MQTSRIASDCFPPSSVDSRGRKDKGKGNWNASVVVEYSPSLSAISSIEKSISMQSLSLAPPGTCHAHGCKNREREKKKKRYRKRASRYIGPRYTTLEATKRGARTCVCTGAYICINMI